MNEDKRIVRICDYERRSREPDSVSPRDPADAEVIVMKPREPVGVDDAWLFADCELRGPMFSI